MPELEQIFAPLAVFWCSICCACSEPYLCPDVPKAHAIMVEVKDSTTGLPAALGVNGYVHDGEFVDSLRQCDPTAESGDVLRLCAAYDRLGVYDVYVAKSGYKYWRRLGVRVDEVGECNVRPALLEVLLQPLEP